LQKKILTINEMLSDNIGDQAIADAMRKFCQVDQGIQVDSEDFSFKKVPCQDKSNNSLKKNNRTWKAYFPNIFKRAFFLFKNVKNAKLIASLKYDLAIIGGGQLILGKGTFPYSLFLYTYFLKRQGTKIKIVSAGVGESFTALEKYLIRKSLNSVDSIYLRDERSIENLKKEFNQESQFLPDIAYFLLLVPKVDDVNSNCTRSLICPVEYSVYKRYSMEMNNAELSYEQYKDLWVNLIRERLQVFDEICISATTIKDFEFSCELKELFNYQEQKKITFRSCQSHQEFISLAKESAEVQSGRMHALILCHNLGLKILPFEISKKLQAYKQEYLNKKAEEFKNMLNEFREEILK